jgi:hypothetical protein
LQVLEDADGAAFFSSGASQAFDVLCVILVGAVRKVQAGNIHAEAKQVAHCGFRVAGGADGADDLRAAGSEGGSGTLGSKEAFRLEFWLTGLHFSFSSITSLKIIIPSDARDLGLACAAT